MDLKKVIDEVAIDLEGDEFTHDPEATRFGIVQSEYDNYRAQHGLDLRTVNEITENEYYDIYIAKFWQPMRCGELPDGVDFVIFQMGVNIGNRGAVKILQRALGITDDGVVGAETLDSAAAADAPKLIDDLLNMQDDYYDSLVSRHPDNQLFSDSLKGLHNRTIKVRLFLATGLTEGETGLSLVGVVAVGILLFLLVRK